MFFFKQKTAYEVRISDWSSDVCSSDLLLKPRQLVVGSVMSQDGWRFGSVAAGALALVLAALVGWQAAYLACAVFALPAMLTGLVMGEPERHKEVSQKRGMAEVMQSITGPLLEFFRRRGAFLVLLFILLHKIGDTLANLTFQIGRAHV